MAQKYGNIANEAAGSSGDRVRCVVCDGSTWSWTDLHGEAFCVYCGTPHQIIGDKKGCNIRVDVIDDIKVYWQETGKRCGLGTFLLWHDYEKELQERKEFYEWLKKRRPELFKEKVEEQNGETED